MPMAQILLQTVWFIPCYPLIGGVLSMLWFPAVTRRTGPRPSGYVNAILTLFAFLHGVIALTAIWNQPAQHQLIPWLNVAGLDLTIPVEISAVTVGATVLITGLNLLAQIYAFGYMEMDWGWARLFSLMGLFEAGMCGLVLCNSLFFSYMILEVLTLGTYLLVGLWFNQSLVVTGARDAFLTKRVGDLFLLMGVVAILPLAGTWNFDELAVWAQTAKLDPTVATLLTLALIAGPMGKCAQFPLHLWLDEAMEGPQPVIALSPMGMTITIIVGAATAVGASLIAIAQIDIKRTLSYIVSAYMGLVFIAVGTGQAETALTLIFAYSLAMGLLVMSIGSVVWNTVTQDVRSLGGLWGKRPISAISFIVGSAGLVGLPPFGCFWALEDFTSGLSQTHPFLLGIVLFVNGLTAFGLVRVFGLVFGGKPKQMTERSPEVHWPFILPMTVLMGFTLHVPHLLAAWNLLPGASLNYTATGLLVLSTAIGIGAGAFVYLNEKWEKPVRIGSQALQDFFAYDFYTAKLYRVTVIFAVGLVAQVISWVDRNIVDGFVNLIGFATVFGGQSLKYNVNGQTQFYALTILFGVALLGLLISWPLLVRLSLIVGG